MLVKITERDLVSRGFSLTDREEWFLAAHPEWKGQTTKLLSIYLTCQFDRCQDGHLGFEDALAHIENCAWCNNRLNSYVPDFYAEKSIQQKLAS